MRPVPQTITNFMYCHAWLILSNWIRSNWVNLQKKAELRENSNITHATEIYKEIFNIFSYHITILLSKHSKIFKYARNLSANIVTRITTLKDLCKVLTPRSLTLHNRGMNTFTFLKHIKGLFTLAVLLKRTVFCLILCQWWEAKKWTEWFCKKTGRFHLHNVKQKTGRFNKKASVNKP